MTKHHYAIKVVPPEWQKGMLLPFDKTAHDAWDVEQGTRVLIYVQDKGIVAEGEVHGYFIEPHRWVDEAKDELPASFANADYLLPIGLLYKRYDVITPQAVRDALADPTFPNGETWRAIDQDAYSRLTNFPG